MAWARQFNHTSRGRLFVALFRLAERPIFRRYPRQIIDNIEVLDDHCHDMTDDAALGLA
jgi:hypothetical protein